jgi:hypothetical protein
VGEVTPLFIFGMGRSGTTNALHVLNSHPEVMLNGEISLSVMKQFFDLLDGVENSYANKDATREGWHARKADYLLESIGYLSKGGRGQLKKIPRARFRGHKSPRHESLFDRYEAHFASVGLAPRYFYCARNPFDCWQSYRATSWNGYETVSAFLAHYMASFAQLEHMRRRAEGRVFLLDLDELIAAGEPLEWYRTRIFAPLGLGMPENLTRRLARSGDEGETSPVPRDISSADRKAIQDYPGMDALIEGLFGKAPARTASF